MIDLTWQGIGEGLIAAIIWTCILFIGAWSWHWIQGGGPIRLLGGLTKKEFQEALQSSLKSLRGDIEARIEFVNQMDEAVVVYWINYQGDEEVKCESLQPQKQFNQTTYVTHPWVVKTKAKNRYVGAIVVTECKHIFLITA